MLRMAQFDTSTEIHLNLTLITIKCSRHYEKKNERGQSSFNLQIDQVNKKFV